MAACACVALTTFSCAPRAPEEGALTRAAVAANQQGRTTARVAPVHEHTGQHTGLGAALETYSFVIATATAERPVQVQRNTILTWHEFRDADWLSRLAFEPGGARSCSENAPRSLSPSSADRLAIPLEFGEATIYSVVVAVESIHATVPIDPGHRYLLVAQECEHGTWRLPFGLFGVLRVMEEGRLQPMMSEPRPFLEELLELETVERLREYIARLHR